MKYTEYPSPVIAERIQQVTKDNNLIDKEVASAIGMERKSIMNCRNCVTNPNVKLIRYICKTYHVSADWLLDLE